MTDEALEDLDASVRRSDPDRWLASRDQHTTTPSARVHVAPQLTGVLRLQRLAGNRAVNRALSVQRCGPTPCDCTEREREQAAADSATTVEATTPEVSTAEATTADVQRAPAPATSVQRVDPDFAVKGLPADKDSIPGSVFFEMNSAALRCQSPLSGPK